MLKLNIIVIIIMIFFKYNYNYDYLTGLTGVADITVERIQVSPFTGSFSLIVGGSNSILLSANSDGNDIKRALELLPTVNIVSVVKSETVTNSDNFNSMLRSESQRITITYEITFMHDHNWYPLDSVYPYRENDSHIDRDTIGVRTPLGINSLTEFRPAFGPMSALSIDALNLNGRGLSTDISVINAGYTTSDTLKIIISDLSFDPSTKISDSLTLSSLMIYVLPTLDPPSVSNIYTYIFVPYLGKGDRLSLSVPYNYLYIIQLFRIYI
jgi:hypothetical protein